MGAEGTNITLEMYITSARKETNFIFMCTTINLAILGQNQFPWKWKAYISQFLQVGTYPALLSDELGAENLEVTYPLSQVTPDVVHEFQLCD